MIQNAIWVIAVLGMASYSDVKRGMISDRLTATLALLGLLFSANTALLAHSAMPVLMSSVGVLLGLVIGILGIKVGAWYGGDAKLYAAMGANIGFNGDLFYYTFYLILFVGAWLLGCKLARKKTGALAPAFLLAYVFLAATTSL